MVGLEASLRLRTQAWSWTNAPLGLVRDVVDAVVALAEAVGVGSVGRGVVTPGRGREPVEVVIGIGLEPGAADRVAEAGAGEAAAGQRPGRPRHTGRHGLSNFAQTPLSRCV